MLPMRQRTDVCKLVEYIIFFCLNVPLEWQHKLNVPLQWKNRSNRVAVPHEWQLGSPYNIRVFYLVPL